MNTSANIPAWLTEGGKATWSKLAKRINLQDASQRTLLALLCDSLSDYVSCVETIKANGLTGETLNIKKVTLVNVLRILKELKIEGNSLVDDILDGDNAHTSN